LDQGASGGVRPADRPAHDLLLVFSSKAPKGKNVVLFPMVGLAFWGLVKMLRAAPAAGWLFLSGWLAFPLVYYVIQLMTRYRYPLEWSIAFLCAFALLHRTGGKREAPAEV